MKKRMISLVLAIVMVLGLIPAMTTTASAGGTGFTDVEAGSFYEIPVQWAVEKGITNGATPTTFNPGGTCLRAHVVTFLHRAAGNPEPGSNRNPFKDVLSSDFFYKPVLWAVEKGITNGISADNFGAYDNCNRAAVVTFLWRTAGSPEPKSTVNPFKDVNTADFFYKPVLWAVEQGITNGVDATHFGPGQDCNRAQVVTFLYRCFSDGMAAPLTITRHPETVRAAEGKSASFSVEVTGGTAPYTYQWQYSDDEGAKWYSSSIKTAIYTTAATADRNGRLIRCVVTDAKGSKVTSNAAKLLVSGMLKIVTHPEDANVTPGAVVYFSVEAVGDDLHYQWQYSDDGTRWTDTAAAGATYITSTFAAKHRRLFRCVVTDSAGQKAVSNAARLLIDNQLKILEQPLDLIVAEGSNASFTVTAEGNGLTYRWQYSDDNGAKWVDSGVSEASYTMTATEALHGRLVRCIVADETGKQVTSRQALLLIRDRIQITAQPGDVTEPVGTAVSLSVEAIGKDLRYRWQYSEDEGATWNNADAVAEVYTTVVTASQHDRLLRCVLTDADGNTVISGTARITVEGLVRIIEQPKGVRCKAGDTVELRVSAEGAQLHYMWQSSTNGVDWIDLDATEPVYTFTADKESFRQKYRCRVWDDQGNSCISDVVSLTDPDALILVQPQNWICGEGSTAYFDIVVAEGVVSRQWQMSSNGGKTWSNSSINGGEYGTSATAEKAGWLYRCVVTDDQGRQEISDEVSFAIENDFVIAVQPENASGELYANVPFEIQVGGTGITYKWQTSTDGETWTDVSGGSSFRYRQQVLPSSMGQYVRCIVTDTNGKTLTSDVAQLRWNGNGFFEHNGRRYYAKEDGQIATDLEYIDGGLYGFYASGIMITGLVQLEDGLYYFTEDGSAARGFVYFESPKYGTLYFGEDHTAAIGWTQIDGNSYYFYDTGVMALGVTQIGSKQYFFDPETGIRSYGMVQVGIDNYMYFPEDRDLPFAGLKEVCGSLYYFSEEHGDYGVTRSGAQTVNGKTYYFDPDTKRAVTGFVTYDNKVHFMGTDYTMVTDAWIGDGENIYLLNSKGTKEYGLVEHNGCYYYLDPETGAAVTGWVDYVSNKLYLDPQTLAAKTGLVELEGVKYYFGTNGYLSTGFVEVDGARYYIAEPGQLKTGFVEINQNVYYLDEEQKAATGYTTIGGKLYCFSDYGVMRTGLQIDGKRYYFDLETGAAVTGIVQLSNGYSYGFNGAKGAGAGLTTINGSLYYLNENGIVTTGRVSVNGKVYYFDPASGKAVSGWQYVRGSDNKVRAAYFDPKTFHGATGLTTINGATYYFDANGWAMSGERTVNGTKYYFSPGTYKAYTGGTRPSRSDVWGTLDGAKCFYGTDGKLLTGLRNLDGALYYFGKDGKMQTGLVTVDGARYGFGDSGAQYGQVTIGGSEYYFSPSNLAMLTGLQKINGALYYYQENGARKNGWITTANGERLYMKDSGLLTGLATIGGKNYFFGSDGVMRTGVQSVKTDAGKTMTCMFDANGVMAKGFVTTDEGIYYYDTTTGERVTGLVMLNGAQYYFYPSTGKAATGRCVIDGFYYYFDSQTAQRKLGFQTANGSRYYFTDSAANKGMARGLTVIEGKTYYFYESNGAMHTGYRFLNGKDYYFDPESGAAVNKIYRQSNGYLYAIRADGGLDQGWTTIEGKTYFFYVTNNRMAQGLTSVDDKLYYFDPDGGMLRNTTVTVGGVPYRLDENGCASAVGDSNLAKLINEGIDSLDKGYGDEGQAENPTTHSCSQLVRRVFSAVGIDISKGIDVQYYALIHGNYDCRIIDDISQAKAGDIVFYTIPDCKYGSNCCCRNEIHHVGVYLGDGKLMDSNESFLDGYGNGPVIRDLDNSSANLIYKLIRIPGVNG